MRCALPLLLVSVAAAQIMTYPEFERQRKTILADNTLLSYQQAERIRQVVEDHPIVIFMRVVDVRLRDSYAGTQSYFVHVEEDTTHTTAQVEFEAEIYEEFVRKVKVGSRVAFQCFWAEGQDPGTRPDLKAYTCIALFGQADPIPPPSEIYKEYIRALEESLAARAKAWLIARKKLRCLACAGKNRWRCQTCNGSGTNDDRVTTVEAEFGSSCQPLDKFKASTIVVELTDLRTARVTASVRLSDVGEYHDEVSLWSLVNGEWRLY